MISVSSNIDDVIKSFQQKANNVYKVDSRLLKKIAQKVQQELLDIYAMYKIDYEDNLSQLSLDDVKIVPNGSTYFITIGENTPMFEMPQREASDKPQYKGLPNAVNPYFFVEFGFGVVGAESPISNSSFYNWKYNLRPYKNGWHYKSKVTGTRAYSSGAVGINAMATVQSHFYRICKEAIKEVMQND